MITAPWSNYDHPATALGRLQNTPIAVGKLSSSGGDKVEALIAGRWRVLADFPFANMISYYSMVNLNDVLYLFGKFIYFTN